MRIDLREKFKDEKWQQGCLLRTSLTSKWTKEEFKDMDHKEHCRVFVNFTARDDGRGRILIYICDSPEECEKLVEEHNGNS